MDRIVKTLTPNNSGTHHVTVTVVYGNEPYFRQQMLAPSITSDDGNAVLNPTSEVYVWSTAEQLTPWFLEMANFLAVKGKLPCDELYRLLHINSNTIAESAPK